MKDYYSAPYGRAKSLNQHIKESKEVAGKRPPLIDDTLNYLQSYIQDSSDVKIVRLNSKLAFVVSDLNIQAFLEATSSSKSLNSTSFKLTSDILILTSKLSYTWHTQFNLNPERRKKLKEITPEIFGLALGLNSLYSKQQDFNDLLAITLATNDRDYCREFVSYKNNTYIFMIMLATDFADLPQRNWDHYLNPEPFLTQVLNHWADEDPSTHLNKLLVQLCNRHTHHTRASTEKNPHDFTGPVLAHIPIEVLMIERLRQWKGLTPVSVDHKLMQTGLATLPGKVESKWGDLLDKVWEKVLFDHPNYKSYLADANATLSKRDLTIEANGFGDPGIALEENSAKSQIPAGALEWAKKAQVPAEKPSPLWPLFKNVLTETEEVIARKFIALCEQGGKVFIHSPLANTLVFNDDSTP